ncbi:glycosyltransferase [Neobacillus sp. K501]
MINLNRLSMTEMARVIKGFMEARSLLRKLKPSLVFSKGGFVSVPVILAASTLRIPIYIHESDMTPGLANNISKRFATKIFTSFEETKMYFPQNMTTVIGSPIRKEITNGSSERGRQFLGFDTTHPIITIMGGSLGAKKINQVVRDSLEHLSLNFQVVHLCGRNNVDEGLSAFQRYKQFEYVHEELPDLLAATDVVITRDGSNAIFEFLALNILMIVIPLGLDQSRGDQILNAEAFQKKGYSLTLEESKLNRESLVELVELVYNNREIIKMKQREASKSHALEMLIREFNKV